MRSHIVALALLTAPLAAPTAARAHEEPFGVSVGFRLSAFPELVQVPGHPVYYAPGVGANYFFHEGLFWLFDGGRWFSSAWYDGPWSYVGPEAVPAFVLRVPVGYYRSPPRWFAGWRHDAPPRWEHHWGNRWARDHRGWDRWDRRVEHRAAPPPFYQRDYRGDRYPRTADHQRAIGAEHGRHGFEDRGHGGGGREDRGREEHRRGRGRGDRDEGRHGGRDDGHGGRGEHR